MLLSNRKNKSKSLPNIKANTNVKSSNVNFKQINNSRKKLDFFSKNINPNINQTITIMDNLRNKSAIPKYYINYRRNNPLYQYNTKKFTKDFEKIKIFKGKAIKILNKNEQSKHNQKEINISNDYNKRHIYLYPNTFNYSCGMDRNEILNINMNKKPRERKKQNIIHLVNNQINIENYEYKLPRMISILRRNDFLQDQLYYEQWKYPFNFSK